MNSAPHVEHRNHPAATRDAALGCPRGSGTPSTSRGWSGRPLLPRPAWRQPRRPTQARALRGGTGAIDVDYVAQGLPAAAPSAEPRAVHWHVAPPRPHAAAEIGQVAAAAAPSQPPPSAQQPAHRPLGAWTAGAVLAAIFAGSLFAMGSAILSVVWFVRPVLIQMDVTLKEMEEAMKAAEKASREVEETALMFQQDLPVTLDAMDAAAMEMEALGEALNGIVGGRRKPSKPRRPPTVQPRTGKPGAGKEDKEPAGGRGKKPEAKGKKAGAQAKGDSEGTPSTPKRALSRDADVSPKPWSPAPVLLLPSGDPMLPGWSVSARGGGAREEREASGAEAGSGAGPQPSEGGPVVQAPPGRKDAGATRAADRPATGAQGSRKADSAGSRSSGDREDDDDSGRGILEYSGELASMALRVADPVVVNDAVLAASSGLSTLAQQGTNSLYEMARGITGNVSQLQGQLARLANKIYRVKELAEEEDKLLLQEVAEERRARSPELSDEAALEEAVRRKLDAIRARGMALDPPDDVQAPDGVAARAGEVGRDGRAGEAAGGQASASDGKRGGSGAESSPSAASGTGRGSGVGAGAMASATAFDDDEWREQVAVAPPRRFGGAMSFWRPKRRSSEGRGSEGRIESLVSAVWPPIWGPWSFGPEGPDGRRDLPMLTAGPGKEELVKQRQQAEEMVMEALERAAKACKEAVEASGQLEAALQTADRVGITMEYDDVETGERRVLDPFASSRSDEDVITPDTDSGMTATWRMSCDLEDGRGQQRPRPQEGAGTGEASLAEYLEQLMERERRNGASKQAQGGRRGGSDVPRID